MASMVHHGGRRGLGSVDLRSAQLCSVSPPYVEKEIWCSFRDRGKSFGSIHHSLIARFNGQIRWQNQFALGLCKGRTRAHVHSHL